MGSTILDSNLLLFSFLSSSLSFLEGGSSVVWTEAGGAAASASRWSCRASVAAASGGRAACGWNSLTATTQARRKRLHCDGCTSRHYCATVAAAYSSPSARPCPRRPRATALLPTPRRRRGEEAGRSGGR